MIPLLIFLVLVLVLAGGFVFYRRSRSNTIEELPLPPDYMPIDYTSLPQEEQQAPGPSRQTRILIAVGLLLIIGSLVAVFMLIGGDEETADTTPEQPAYAIELQAAELVSGSDGLQLDVTGRTDVPEGTEITARVLESGQPFALLDEDQAAMIADSTRILWTIPVDQSFETATRGVSYTLVLEADVDGDVISDSMELDVLSSAEVAFYEGAQPTATPRPSPTAPRATPTTAPLPTIGPIEVGGEDEGPVETTATRGATLYLSPFGPSGARGQVATGQAVLVVAKLWNDDYYLVAAGSSTGWVEGAALNLSGVNVPTAGGNGNRAAVFNGGNIRQTPGTGAPVGQVHAGQTVTLLARNTDSSWYRVEAPEGTGWVSAVLLTIDPAVAASVPIQ